MKVLLVGWEKEQFDKGYRDANESLRKIGYDKTRRLFEHRFETSAFTPINTMYANGVKQAIDEWDSLNGASVRLIFNALLCSEAESCGM